MAKKYHVFNATDGVYATHTPLNLIAANEFIKDFPKRYKHQGYYLTHRQERINPEDVVLELVERNKIPTALAVICFLLLSLFTGCVKTISGPAGDQYRDAHFRLTSPTKPGFSVVTYYDYIGHNINWHQVSTGVWVAQIMNADKIYKVEMPYFKPDPYLAASVTLQYKIIGTTIWFTAIKNGKATSTFDADIYLDIYEQ